MKKLIIIAILLLLVAGCNTDSSGHQNTTDTTPPTISVISILEVTETTAVVTWTTNEPATSRVEYGTTSAYGLTTPLDHTLVHSHSIALSGLAPGITYYYRVKSADGSSNEAVSDGDLFLTLQRQITTGRVQFFTGLGGITGDIDAGFIGEDDTVYPYSMPIYLEEGDIFCGYIEYPDTLEDMVFFTFKILRITGMSPSFSFKGGGGLVNLRLYSPDDGYTQFLPVQVFTSLRLRQDPNFSFTAEVTGRYELKVIIYWGSRWSNTHYWSVGELVYWVIPVGISEYSIPQQPLVSRVIR